MFNSSRLATNHAQILAIHRSPCDNGRTSAPPAIDAMTISQRKGLAFQLVPRPAAKTSAGHFHISKFFCSGGRVDRNHQLFNPLIANCERDASQAKELYQLAKCSWTDCAVAARTTFVFWRIWSAT